MLYFYLVLCYRESSVEITRNYWCRYLVTSAPAINHLKYIKIHITMFVCVKLQNNLTHILTKISSCVWFCPTSVIGLITPIFCFIRLNIFMFIFQFQNSISKIEYPQRVLKDDKLFYGTVLLSGDFRQTLAVIPRSTFDFEWPYRCEYNCKIVH